MSEPVSFTNFNSSIGILLKNSLKFILCLCVPLILYKNIYAQQIIEAPPTIQSVENDLIDLYAKLSRLEKRIAEFDFSKGFHAEELQLLQRTKLELTEKIDRLNRIKISLVAAKPKQNSFEVKETPQNVLINNTTAGEMNSKIVIKKSDFLNLPEEKRLKILEMRELYVIVE